MIIKVYKQKRYLNNIKHEYLIRDWKQKRMRNILIQLINI